MKLISIKLIKKYDYNADTEFLGYYSNEWKEGAIETKKGRGYYKYFISTMSEPEYAQQDYEFMEGIENGEHIAYYAYAEATIEVMGVYQYIQSGGLYGIWDDVEEYVYTEELEALKDILLDMGISQTEISGIMVVNADD